MVLERVRNDIYQEPETKMACLLSIKPNIEKLILELNKLESMKSTRTKVNTEKN